MQHLYCPHRMFITQIPFFTCEVPLANCLPFTPPSSTETHTHIPKQLRHYKTLLNFTLEVKCHMCQYKTDVLQLPLGSNFISDTNLPSACNSLPNFENLPHHQQPHPEALRISSGTDNIRTFEVSSVNHEHLTHTLQESGGQIVHVCCYVLAFKHGVIVRFHLCQIQTLIPDTWFLYLIKLAI